MVSPSEISTTVASGQALLGALGLVVDHLHRQFHGIADSGGLLQVQTVDGLGDRLTILRGWHQQLRRSSEADQRHVQFAGQSLDELGRRFLGSLEAAGGDVGGHHRQ